MEYKKRVVSFRLVKEQLGEIGSAKIRRSEDIADFMRPIFGDEIGIFERMYLVTLNQGNNIVSVTMISQGGLAGTVVDVRLIAKYALDSLATSFILCHNHPSGNKKPSTADVKVTRKAKEALDLLDIKILDHIILTEESYFSFADDGLI